MEQPQLTITASHHISWFALAGYFDRLESTPLLKEPKCDWLGTGDNAEVFSDQQVTFHVPPHGAHRFYRVVRLPTFFTHLWDTAGLIKIYD